LKDLAGAFDPLRQSATATSPEFRGGQGRILAANIISLASLIDGRKQTPSFQPFWIHYHVETCSPSEIHLFAPVTLLDFVTYSSPLV
jgi:hypothetical protein